MSTIRTAIIITIGDELLIGQTIDTNSAYMGEKLTALGISIIEKLAIPDEDNAIQNTLGIAVKRADLVLITGGLGPTKDDITKKSIADFLGVKLQYSQAAYDNIKRLFDKLGRPMKPAHKDQALIPETAKLLDNHMGTALGMQFEVESTTIVSMPGVPYEMRYIMEHGVLPMISQRLSQAIATRTLLTVGRGESMIADQIEPILAQMPEHMSIAYLPSIASVRLRLTAIGSEQEALEADVQKYGDLIAEDLGDIVYGEGKDRLAEVVGDLYQEKAWNLMTAESCTGGRLASEIVAIAGSSAYYQGSIVAYDNALKEDLLYVPNEVIEKHGAVSEETVRAMVQGGLRRVGTADVCIAISGVAGPSGGTEEKPVGTVWMAVGSKDRIITKRIKGTKDREKIIAFTCIMGLDLLRRFAMYE